LSISAVFDSGFAESLECWPGALSASGLAGRFAETGGTATASAAGVDPRPTPAMQGVLQGIPVLVRKPMHSESVVPRRNVALPLISRQSARSSLNQFKFRTIEY
jgi:hypothetical protein